MKFKWDFLKRSPRCGLVWKLYASHPCAPHTPFKRTESIWCAIMGIRTPLVHDTPLSVYCLTPQIKFYLCRKKKKKTVLESQKSWEDSTENSHISHCQFPLLFLFYTSMVHLSQLMSHCCYIIINWCITQWNTQFSSVVQSCLTLCQTPWATALKAFLSITNSWSLPKLMSIESVMPASHFIICCLLIFLPLIFPRIRVFSNESFFASGGQSIGVSASTSVFPMNTQVWFPLGWTGWISWQSKGLSRLLQYHSSKTLILQCSAFFIVQLSGILIYFRIFHSLLWSTQSNVFLELSCFFVDPADVVNLISGSSAFSKTSLNIWRFTVHVLLKPGLENFEHHFTSMWDECNCVVVWAFFGIAFLWDYNEDWPFPVLWPLLSFPNLLAYWVQHFHSIIFQDLK